MNKIINQLLVYGRVHLGLKDVDLIYIQNRLLEMLKVDAFLVEPVDQEAISKLTVPDTLIEQLKQHIIKRNLVAQEEIDRFVGAIFGLLTPMPSMVNERFNDLYQISSQEATNYLYDLSIKNDYIKKTFTDANIHWIAPFERNYLEITINMSKPEKRNEDIAKLVSAKPNNTSYPRCVLCLENEGYYGRSDFNNRSNLRTISLTLDDEEWFLQYSPYVYYDQHCIVIDKVHRPMVINKQTMSKLFAFVDQFPHFFIGSNSDLPIVGGSILNHEHFQGGAHLLPLMKSGLLYEKKFKDFPETEAYILDWYNSAILLKGKDKEQLLTLSQKLISIWRTYDDPSRHIISKTDNNHNTATVLLRKENETYLQYIILRNNRTDATYLGGIFHAHPEYYHIKSEGIGLIEAGGLFILPSRLKRQLDLIELNLKNQVPINQIIEQHPDLAMFNVMMATLKENLKTNVKQQIEQYVNEVCRNILLNTSVFKKDQDGFIGLNKFLDRINNGQ